MKTLVVEDNLRDLKLLHSILQMDGHEVLDAMSAEQALSLLEENNPEVILIDLHLPQMNGIDLGHQLKHTAATARIPIIAVTACADEFSRQAARDAGFSGYFLKPINTRTLSQDVAAILNSCSTN